MASRSAETLVSPRESSANGANGSLPSSFAPTGGSDEVPEPQASIIRVGTKSELRRVMAVLLQRNFRAAAVVVKKILNVKRGSSSTVDAAVAVGRLRWRSWSRASMEPARPRSHCLHQRGMGRVLQRLPPSAARSLFLGGAALAVLYLFGLRDLSGVTTAAL